jgi:hypothetical protein
VPRDALKAASATKLGLAGVCLLALAALALGPLRGAGAATVIYKDLVLHVTGGFQPQTLPRRSYAPIEFQGELDLSSRSGRQPPALTEAVVYFNRAGLLDTEGLPTCAADQVAGLDSEAARAACRGAIVGEGTVEAELAGVQLSAPLTIFNGPAEADHPTAVLHAAFGAPVNQVFAIPVPIERIPGAFRYRVTVQVPPLALGRASLTRLHVEIGRRYRVGGERHSYVSARCNEAIVRTRGRFTFAEGTVVDGTVERFCRGT